MAARKQRFASASQSRTVSLLEIRRIDAQKLLRARRRAAPPARVRAAESPTPRPRRSPAPRSVSRVVPVQCREAGRVRRGAPWSRRTGQSVEPPHPMVAAARSPRPTRPTKSATAIRRSSFNPGNGPLDRVRVDSGGRVLTTNQGVPVADNQNSLKAGLRGPTLLEDFILREKITHFDHERIPERIVHARGSGAHGYFECYEPLTELTRASIFAEAGKRTPVFVRFSTVAGERGSTDTARDVRGFAVKFYTDEGNWDLVGNNIPVFFIQDAMKFPDLVHAVKPEPHHGMPQAASAHDTFWDFVSLMPESTHMLMWVMSDRAIPRSYRMMQGFGVHTFRFVNEQGESQFVKFHWKPVAGTHSLVWDEAVKISGADPDFHRRDLWEAIEAGAYPEWELGVQVFTEEDAERLQLRRARRDQDHSRRAGAADSRSAAWCSTATRTTSSPRPSRSRSARRTSCRASTSPTIRCSPGRIHSYVDTQISRLGGPNFHEIPINAPVAQVHNNQRDGMHRQAINRGRVAYEPNSLGGGCPFQAGAQGFTSFPEPVEERQGARQARAVRRALQPGDAVLEQPDRRREGAHHQGVPLRADQGADARDPRARRGAAAQRRRRARARRGRRPRHDELPEPLPQRARARAEAGSRDVAGAVAFARPGQDGIMTRRIAILVADGVDGEAVTALHEALSAQGAVPRFVGIKLGQVQSANGDPIDVEVSIETAPSVVWDAMVLPDGDAAIRALSANGHAMEFLKDQYRHCKTILALGTFVLDARPGRHPAQAAFRARPTLGCCDSAAKTSRASPKCSPVPSRSTAITTARPTRRAFKVSRLAKTAGLRAARRTFVQSLPAVKRGDKRVGRVAQQRSSASLR